MLTLVNIYFKQPRGKHILLKCVLFKPYSSSAQHYLTHLLFMFYEKVMFQIVAKKCLFAHGSYIRDYMHIDG